MSLFHKKLAQDAADTAAKEPETAQELTEDALSAVAGGRGGRHEPPHVFDPKEKLKELSIDRR